MNIHHPFFEQFNLSGRTALVTGSSQGIGRSIALALAASGANVIVHYAGRADLAAQTAKACADAGVRAETTAADLTRPSAAAALHAEAVRLLGDPDILVLNASVQYSHTWREVTEAEAEAQWRANFLSSYELIRLCHPAMGARKWGRILAVGSVQQVCPSPHMPVYAATKSAQLNLVRNLAKTFAPDGITVNNLAPGVIETVRNETPLGDENIRNRWLRSIPVGFLGQPDDCAAAALLLCSPAGRYITGADLMADGGLSL